MQVSLKYAEEHFADLISAVNGGEEVEIAQAEKPSIKLVPSTPVRKSQGTKRIMRLPLLSLIRFSGLAVGVVALAFLAVIPEGNLRLPFASATATPSANPLWRRPFLVKPHNHISLVLSKICAWHRSLSKSL